MCCNGSVRCPAAFTKPRCLIEERNIITRSCVYVWRGFAVIALFLLTRYIKACHCKNESRPRKVLERARRDGEIKVSFKAKLF